MAISQSHVPERFVIKNAGAQFFLEINAKTAKACRAWMLAFKGHSEFGKYLDESEAPYIVPQASVVTEPSTDSGADPIADLTPEDYGYAIEPKPAFVIRAKTASPSDMYFFVNVCVPQRDGARRVLKPREENKRTNVCRFTGRVDFPSDGKVLLKKTLTDEKFSTFLSTPGRSVPLLRETLKSENVNKSKGGSSGGEAIEEGKETAGEDAEPTWATATTVNTSDERKIAAEAVPDDCGKPGEKTKKVPPPLSIISCPESDVTAIGEGEPNIPRAVAIEIPLYAVQPDCSPRELPVLVNPHASPLPVYTLGQLGQATCEVQASPLMSATNGMDKSASVGLTRKDALDSSGFREAVKANTESAKAQFRKGALEESAFVEAIQQSEREQKEKEERKAKYDRLPQHMKVMYDIEGNLKRDENGKTLYKVVDIYDVIMHEGIVNELFKTKDLMALEWVCFTIVRHIKDRYMVDVSPKFNVLRSHAVSMHMSTEQSPGASCSLSTVHGRCASISIYVTCILVYTYLLVCMSASLKSLGDI
jgi:hypothetical protein